PATSYLEFLRTGERSGGGRGINRKKLKLFMLAELFENEGEFLDGIANGIWAICDESSWVSPAHLYLQEAGPGLPDVEEPVVDLSVGSTVNLLSWVEYFFGEKLDSVSPLIRDRLYLEVNQRVLEPCLKRDDFWWMGKGKNFTGLINNWTPWIASNWLMANLIFEKEESRRAEATWKSLGIVDKFINSYPDDGACDEGPGYWFHAGGKLFDFLEVLHNVSKGEINVYDEPIVREMGRYLYRVHIADDKFVNFADASSKIHAVYRNYETLFKYGERINDPVLMAFGADFAGERDAAQVFSSKGSVFRALRLLLLHEKIASFSGAAPYPADHFFSGREVFISRDKAGATEGFFVAAKGGHNDESHNHNDVGNFIVYYDGSPVIIDAGVGRYTAKTFSDQRYEIWTMQSQYHNCPTINGVMQPFGRNYKAKDVGYSSKENEINFNLGLEKAYPDTAHVGSWKRTIRHLKGEEIHITDQFKLTKQTDTTFVPLILNKKPEILDNKDVVLNVTGNNSTRLLLTFNATSFDPVVEKIDIEDSRLKNAWGESLYRLKLVYTKKLRSGELNATIKRYHEN
ncbi:MAG: heparinase II/III domain-containing protein, partial [Marinilabiliaceae bacterium]